MIIPLLALVVLCCVLAGPAQGKDDLVEFSAQRSDKAFTINCKLLTEEIGRSDKRVDKWIDRCNELGQAALDAAAASGEIAPVTGLAFGMASQHIRQLPASTRFSKGASMSRVFPLAAKSP